MTLDKDFYTVPEVVEMIRALRGKVPGIYSDIRLGNLKATKRRSPATGRICKVIAQSETERYLKRLGISCSIASVEAHTHLRTPLRNLALLAVREYLATVPSRTREDEALALVMEALPAREISVALRTVTKNVIVERDMFGRSGRESKARRKAG